MSPERGTPCVWYERVSAFLDGELPPQEHELVLTHIDRCNTCAELRRTDVAVESQSPRDRVDTILRALPESLPLRVRVALFAVGALLVALSVPDFIRGSTQGDSLHDLRHLAIWQAAVGTAAIAAAFTLRLSWLVTTIAVTFLMFTGIAAVYDFATGHSGPWTDPIHVIEIVAVALLLRLAKPHLPSMITRR